MGLHVQTATNADIPAWLELAAEVSDLFGVEMASDPEFQRALQRNVERGTALCVRINDELAGGMLWRGGWINWLGVRKQFRRQGVGRALVAHAVSVHDDDVRVITFGGHHPHPEAVGARRLYTAMGFEVSDETPVLPPDGTPREIMIRRAGRSGLG
jgi:GNAT superfamily N-acetyltransferase